MKLTLAILTALFLTACQSSPLMRTLDDEHTMCLRDGFAAGSMAYAQCRQILLQERMHARQAMMAGAYYWNPPLGRY